MNKLAVIFHRFGPYHQARLQAVASRLDLLAIEESAETVEYAWDAVPAPGGFECVTLLAAGNAPRKPSAAIASRLRAVLDEHRPAAVAIPGWSDPAALTALDWGLTNRVPCIVMSESTVFDEPRRVWKEAIKSRVVRLCSSGLAGGQPHAEYLEKLGMERSRIFTGYDVVNNAHFTAGADKAREHAASERVNLSLPERYFLASSRFVEQKNLLALLQAYFLYHQKAGQLAWKLVLLGDGQLRARIVEMRASLKLDDDVLLPGFKQAPELPAYYGLASAFVHASTREPWGLVVNEAMAAGLPVIVSERCGCARDLVREGENGFSFNPADVPALADLLTRVAGTPVRELAVMGEASRQIIARWSPDTFGENLAHAAELAVSLPMPYAGWRDRLLLRGLIFKASRQAAR